MYHYTESGMNNVWLTNGYRTRKTPDGDAVAIVDLVELHSVIGLALCERAYMTGAQFRFLRKELDLSQVRVSSLMGASEESVSLWERKGRIPKHAMRFMQAMYLEAIHGSVKFKNLLEELADMDRDEQEQLFFSESDRGWAESEPQQQVC